MKIKMLLAFFGVVFMLGAAVSCTASEEPLVIGFSPTAPKIPISGLGDTIAVKLVANGNWSIKEGDVMNATPSVASGVAGTTELTLTIGPNSTGANRPVIVRFSLAAGDLTKGFIIWNATQSPL